VKARARMGLAFAFGVIVFLGVLAFVRLAPADPAIWHVDLAAAGFDPARGQMFCITPDNRFGPLADGALARLDAIALATPRTERLAGSAEEGRITWVTRSRLMGYPDYTTAQVMPGPGLCVFGRQRFGREDFGVNGARIAGWMQELLGLPEPPSMTGPSAQP
jgi:uncharacterized protein (DUF1499 family)